METIPTLRKLARKSIFHFGRYEGTPVGSVVDTDMTYIAFIYYHIEGISFVDDILEQCGITGDYVIKKPSVNEEVYNRWRSNWVSQSIDDLKAKLMEEQGMNENLAHMLARKKICGNITRVANAEKSAKRRYGMAKYWNKNVMQARNQGKNY